MRVTRFAHHLRDVLFELRLFEKIGAGPLLASHRAAEFRDQESGLQRFGKSPARLLAPFSCQVWIFPFDLRDVAGNLDCNSLAAQSGCKIGANRLSIAIELN